MKHIGIYVVQIAALCAIAAAGEYMVHAWDLPIPGALIGMLILFLLLSTGMVKAEWIEFGANLLIGNLLLFFIPSAIGIINYGNLFGVTGMLLVGVVVASICILLASIIGSTIWITKYKRKVFRVWQKMQA